MFLLCSKDDSTVTLTSIVVFYFNTIENTLRLAITLLSRLSHEYEYPGIVFPLCFSWRASGNQVYGSWHQEFLAMIRRQSDGTTCGRKASTREPESLRHSNQSWGFEVGDGTVS